MGRFLKNLLSSAAGAMGDSLTSRDYQLDRQGFATDAERLRGDFSAIGRDLRKTLKREQQTDAEGSDPYLSRVISFRKANKREVKRYEQETQS